MIKYRTYHQEETYSMDYDYPVFANEQEAKDWCEKNNPLWFDTVEICECCQEEDCECEEVQS